MMSSDEFYEECMSILLDVDELIEEIEVYMEAGDDK